MKKIAAYTLTILGCISVVLMFGEPEETISMYDWLAWFFGLAFLAVLCFGTVLLSSLKDEL